MIKIWPFGYYVKIVVTITKEGTS